MIFFSGRAREVFLNQCVKLFFFFFERFHRRKFWVTFYFILFHLSIQVLTLEIYIVKPLWYTCEYNNWYKLWKSRKLGIFLLLLDIKFTRAWRLFLQKRARRNIFRSIMSLCAFEPLSFWTLSINYLVLLALYCDLLYGEWSFARYLSSWFGTVPKLEIGLRRRSLTEQPFFNLCSLAVP